MPQSRASGRKATSANKDDAPAEKQRIAKILRLLKKSYPDVECALLHRNAYELLAATILSAQCTDARVNQTTPALFDAYPDPFSLAEADLADVEQIIRSLGFFRSKAKSLVGMAQGLVERHDGEVPEDLEALCKLPGVGRKTANVLLGVWYDHPSGVVVDTHVKRISRLLGLTTANQPEKIEQELMQKLPRKEWIDFSHRLIYHGRQICIARRPQCRECRLLAVCPRVGLPALPEE